MVTEQIDFTADILDVRDIIERFEELELEPIPETLQLRIQTIEYGWRRTMLKRYYLEDQGQDFIFIDVLDGTILSTGPFVQHWLVGSKVVVSNNEVSYMENINTPPRTLKYRVEDVLLLEIKDVEDTPPLGVALRDELALKYDPTYDAATTRLYETNDTLYRVAAH